jgi:alpha-1,3-rhamnosyl/mannosyltransferase
MTVHDVAAVTHPHLHPPAATALQRAAVAATHRASLVLADSQATADALAALGGGVDRLVVVPLGLTGLPAPTTAHVPAQPFLLAVGELAARKSLDVLLAALATLPPPLRLVLAGPLGYRGGDVLAEIDRLGLAHRVSVLGPVGDATLAGLFSSAQLLCFTSAAEGFGLPVLEAMGSGLPVVASDLAVTRELAGDAAVFFPAGDAAELAGAVSGLLAAPARREAMRQRGRERAALFTWQRTAQLTAAAYREALA